MTRGVHGGRSKGRRVLLAFVDANRGLAMLGPPEHCSHCDACERGVAQ